MTCRDDTAWTPSPQNGGRHQIGTGGRLNFRMPGRHHRNPHFSYGFRPGRSQHDALDALIVGISSRKVNFILDADIRSFFTEVSQEWVVRFLEHRIGYKRIIRLVQKWLRAGIVEDGVVTIEEKGTGQGSVISPLLANVYLHYVFDLWAERWRRREAAGGGAIGRVGGGAGPERADTARGPLGELGGGGGAGAEKATRRTGEGAGAVHGAGDVRWAGRSSPFTSARRSRDQKIERLVAEIETFASNLSL